MTKYWHAYPYFWTTIVKSCHVYLGVRSKGGLGACVILINLNLNGGRRHSCVKLKIGNVEVNLDSLIEQVNQSWSMLVWDHGIGNPWN